MDAGRSPRLLGEQLISPAARRVPVRHEDGSRPACPSHDRVRVAAQAERLGAGRCHPGPRGARRGLRRHPGRARPAHPARGGAGAPDPPRGRHLDLGPGRPRHPPRARRGAPAAAGASSPPPPAPAALPAGAARRRARRSVRAPPTRPAETPDAGRARARRRPRPRPATPARPPAPARPWPATKQARAGSGGRRPSPSRAVDGAGHAAPAAAGRAAAGRPSGRRPRRRCGAAGPRRALVQRWRATCRRRDELTLAWGDSILAAPLAAGQGLLRRRSVRRGRSTAQPCSPCPTPPTPSGARSAGPTSRPPWPPTSVARSRSGSTGRTTSRRRPIAAATPWPATRAAPRRSAARRRPSPTGRRHRPHPAHRRHRCGHLVGRPGPRAVPRRRTGRRGLTDADLPDPIRSEPP